MSTQRVTQNAVMDRFVTQAEGDYSTLAKTQQELSSGNRVVNPSDDPFAATQILDYSQQLSDNQQFQTNVGSALSYLQTQDTTLRSVDSDMTSITTLISQAAGTNQDDPTAMANYATELAAIKQHLLDTANTQYGSQGYMFAGTTTTTVPYPNNSYNAVANAGAISTPIAPGVSQQLNLVGPQVFGNNGGATPATMNVFDLIDQITTDITAVPPAINNLSTLDLPAMQGLQANLHTVQAQVGTNEDNLQSIQTSLTAVQEQLTQNKSSVQGVDLAQATIDFQTQSNTYQAALQAGAMMMKTSILNFLS